MENIVITATTIIITTALVIKINNSNKLEDVKIEA